MVAAEITVSVERTDARPTCSSVSRCHGPLLGDSEGPGCQYYHEAKADHKVGYRSHEYWKPCRYDSKGIVTNNRHGCLSGRGGPLRRWA